MASPLWAKCLPVAPCNLGHRSIKRAACGVICGCSSLAWPFNRACRQDASIVHLHACPQLHMTGFSWSAPEQVLFPPSTARDVPACQPQIRTHAALSLRMWTQGCS